MQSCVLLTELSVFITWTESCAVVGYLGRQYGTILPSVSRKKTELFVQYNESFTDQSCSDKWLDIRMFMDFNSVLVHNAMWKKKKLDQNPAISTSWLANNPNHDTRAVTYTYMYILCMSYGKWEEWTQTSTGKKNLPSWVIGKSLSLGSLILCHSPSACDTTFYSHMELMTKLTFVQSVTIHLYMW